MTADQAALSILLGSGSQASKQRKLSALAKAANALLNGEVECPDCGHMGPHDDNGRSGDNREFSCAGCGLNFTPEKPL